MVVIPMSEDECKLAMRNLRPRLSQYARLLVRAGVNVQPGQELVLTAPIEAADFARLVVREAYAAGAGHVTVRSGRMTSSLASNTRTAPLNASTTFPPGRSSS